MDELAVMISGPCGRVKLTLKRRGQNIYKRKVMSRDAFKEYRAPNGWFALCVTYIMG